MNRKEKAGMKRTDSNLPGPGGLLPAAYLPRGVGRGDVLSFNLRLAKKG